MSPDILLWLACTQLLATLGALAGVVATGRQNRRLFLYQQSQNADRDRIVARLNEFYGPLRILLKRTESLYRLFAHVRESAQGQDAEALLRDALIPLNDDISKLIESRGHLIHESDAMTLYTEFLLHADALRFLARAGADPPGVHVAFPRDFPIHIDEMYRCALAEYEAIRGGNEKSLSNNKAVQTQ